MCNRYWITLLGEDPYFILLLLGSGQCRTLYCRCKLHVRGHCWAHRGTARQRIAHSEIIITITINSVCSSSVPSVRATCSVLSFLSACSAPLQQVASIVGVLLGNSPASEVYMPTFRNTVSSS
jgi:hypothetical protein